MTLRTLATLLATTLLMFGLTSTAAAQDAPKPAAPAAAKAADKDEEDELPTIVGKDAGAAPHGKAKGKEAAKAAAGEEDDDVKPPADRHGEVKEFGLVITNVTKIDIIKEAWEFEALLTMAGKAHVAKCDAKALQDLFPSGAIKKSDETNEWEEGGLDYRECKITVEHTSNINVARYPFDQHELEIEVGDEGESLAGVEFKPMTNPDAMGVNPTVKLSGWEFGELAAHQEKEVDKHTKKSVTKVAFTLHAHRPAVASFVKGFLAVCFQLLIALVALVLAVKAAPNRIALVTGALIAVATAHNQVSTSVGVSYLTTADKFFFLSYFLLLANVVFTAIMIRAEDQKNEPLIKSMYKTAWYVLPALTLIGSILVLSGAL